MEGYSSDSSDSWSTRSTDSVDTPRELKFVCTYGEENRIVTVDSNITFSSMISELSTRCANGSSISFKYKFPRNDTLISVASDKDLKLMIQEYIDHYDGFNSQQNQEYMKLVLSAASSGSRSFFSNMLNAVRPGPDIELVNNTNVRLEFLECPRHLQEKLVEKVEPYETKETYKKKFQSRFKETHVPTTIAIRGGKSEAFCQPEYFSNCKNFVFTLDDRSNLIVKKSC